MWWEKALRKNHLELSIYTFWVAGIPFRGQLRFSRRRGLSAMWSKESIVKGMKVGIELLEAGWGSVK